MGRRGRNRTGRYGRDTRMASGEGAESDRATVVRQHSSSGDLSAVSDSDIDEDALLDEELQEDDERSAPVDWALDGASLRAKFMTVFALVIIISMAVMVGLLGWLSNSFLFGQAQHKGVELAKMTAQVGRAVADNRNLSDIEVEDRIRAYMQNARTWGEGANATEAYSDILAVEFQKGRSLDGTGIGPRSTQSMSVALIERVQVPRPDPSPCPMTSRSIGCRSPTSRATSTRSIVTASN